MRTTWIFASLTLAGLVGCGSEESRIRLVPVTGTVTLNGKPMADATVSFVPDASNKVSTPGLDATGPEGTYKLMYKGRSGVAPGKYRVVITPAIKGAEGQVPDQFKEDPYMAQLATSSKPNAPEKKSALTRTEFEAEVGEEGAELDFDAKGKATAGVASSS